MLVGLMSKGLCTIQMPLHKVCGVASRPSLGMVLKQQVQTASNSQKRSALIV